MPQQSHDNNIVRLNHMLDFARTAVEFNNGKRRGDLDSNPMLAFASIHLIELIGEASRTVTEELRNRYPEVPWESISGTRNRLAHGYIDVDLDIIWTIITSDLPPLIVQLRSILRSER